MKPDNALKQNLGTDLTDLALEDASIILGPAFIYQFIVSPTQRAEAAAFLKERMAQPKLHPLAPFLSLSVDESYIGYEWSISANGKTLWSSGA